MLSNFPIIILIVLLLNTAFAQKLPTRNLEYKEKIEQLMRAQDMQGTIVVYDASNNIYYSNDFALAEKGNLPASTFKIVNTIIALETQVLTDENTIMRWDGKKRRFDFWEKDMTVREAFHASCLPCYQEVARKIGVKRMRTYLKRLQYPHMEVDENTIDNFWIKGPSRISPLEQILFLQRFYSRQLPISAQTYDKMISIFEKEKNDNYRYFGKTGWSDDNNWNNGWFVGIVDKGGKVYYFALNVEPIDQANTSKFTAGREWVTREVLKLLQIH